MLLLGNNPLVLVHTLAFSSSELQQSGAAVGKCPCALWLLPLPLSPPVTLVGAAQRRPQLGTPWMQLEVLPDSPLRGFVLQTSNRAPASAADRAACLIAPLPAAPAGLPP